MDIQIGDRLIMKKNHPCGGNVFTVLRVGMDFRLRCETCSREIMSPRKNIEKRVKSVISAERKENNAQ